MTIRENDTELPKRCMVRAKELRLFQQILKVFTPQRNQQNAATKLKVLQHQVRQKILIEREELVKIQEAVKHQALRI